MEVDSIIEKKRIIEKIKIQKISKFFLVASVFILNMNTYSAVSKLGATSIVPVTAVIPTLDPVLSYKGSGISHMAFMRQDMDIKGQIVMGITSYKQEANGFDGVVTLKYPKSIQLIAPEASGLTYNVKLDFNTISGEVDRGSGTDREIEILVPLGKETLKSIDYTISGNAPVPGQYEGIADFTLEYN